MFRVSARTVLELGAELISSDAIAIYELVKNSIDAGSTTGVTIEISISIRHSHYIDLMKRIDDSISLSVRERWSSTTKSSNLLDLKTSIIERIQSTAPEAARLEIVASIELATSLGNLRDAFAEIYKTHNWMEFRDTGCGMSANDLLSSYLVIGTPSRRH